LNAEIVVKAGVGLARRDGLDALSMRSLAAELGVTPMALYRHVGDASALHHAVVARILDELPDPPGSGPWQRRLREWAAAAREVLSRYPGMARFALRHWSEQPRLLDIVEQLLGITAEAGLDAVAAANAVFAYVLMRVQAEEALRAGGLTRQLKALRNGAERLPRLWANAEEYSTARLDEHFSYGLDALVGGLAGARRRARRTGRGAA
jgi:AcrR family transcriptional regulator